MKKVKDRQKDSNYVIIPTKAKNIDDFFAKKKELL